MLERAVRLTLWISVPMNLFAAYVYAFPTSWCGELLQLPSEIPLLHRAFGACFLALYGLAYGWLASQPTLHRPLLGFGAFSKAVVFGLITLLWLTGQAPITLALAACGDLLLAGLWLIWLARSGAPA